MKKSKLTINLIGLLCAIWFALTSWLWTYFANLILSLPFGIIAFTIWYKARTSGLKNILHQWILIVLVFGLAASLISLFLFL